MNRINSQNSKVKKTLVKRWLIKLTLNLLILAGIVVLVPYSYNLFTKHQTEPLRASIVLIIGITFWVAVVKLSVNCSPTFWLSYGRARPSFKLTTSLVLIILTIFTFAGVQPMATYKNNFVSGWASYWERQNAGMVDKDPAPTSTPVSGYTRASTPTPAPLYTPSYTATLVPQIIPTPSAIPTIQYYTPIPYTIKTITPIPYTIKPYTITPTPVRCTPF